MYISEPLYSEKLLAFLSPKTGYNFDYILLNIILRNELWALLLPFLTQFSSPYSILKNSLNEKQVGS